MKLIISFALAFIVLTATTNIALAQSTTQQADTAKTVVIKVKGITCAMDLKRIADNVEKLKGVNSCKTGKMGTTSSFEVKFNPTLIAEKEITTAIESTVGCENPNDRPYKVKQ